MPDHQQAAVLALFEKIMGEYPTTPAPVRFALLSDEDKSVFREALAAAEPHLRKKWAEEIREKVNPPDVDYSHEWRRGFTVGAIKAARFVEGAGNE